MSESLTLLARPAQDDPGDALTARVAEIARRLADVMVAHCSPASGAREAAEFLTSWAGATDEVPSGWPVTLERLITRLGLSELETELVLLAGLAEEHQGLAATLRSLHPHGDPWPTLGLAALLVGGTMQARSRIRAAVAEGRAFSARLLATSASGPFFERSLMLASDLWSALHGHDAWPTAIPRVEVGVPSGFDGWLRERAPGRALACIAAGEPACILVTSDDEAIGLARCAALAYEARGAALAARVELTDHGQLAMLSLHATIRAAVPVAIARRAADAIPQTVSVAPIIGPIVICAPPGLLRPPTDRPVVWLPAAAVSAADQRTAWRHALPGLPSARTAAWSVRHRLDPAVTAQLALDLDGLEGEPGAGDIAGLIRTRLSVALPPGVDLVTPDVPWSDLVLPAEGASQLADAVARLDHESRVLEEWGLRRRAHALHGARLLLCGPPGTGKSLAARAVATAAGTDLLVVDVSRIVSKWLGETEKNLSAAFDAAERTQAVLMLDEADALFGTRTEISDAHDRYANLETAYLLSRLDRFEGLTILTTNMRANIDPAFLRRIDYLVEFPLPDRTGRVELWRRHLPTEPLEPGLDLDALAGLYPVPGAWIRNVSIAGAFAAAADGGILTQQLLVDAMRREYAKASLPFPGVPPRRRQ